MNTLLDYTFKKWKTEVAMQEYGNYYVHVFLGEC